MSRNPNNKPGTFDSPVFQGITIFGSNSDTLDTEGKEVAPTKQIFTDRLRTFLQKKATFLSVPAKEDVLQLMYEGDYWQNGSLWMGPLPEELPDEIRYEIQRYFASRNIIKECVDRHLDAIVGEDPRINTTVRRSLPTEKKKDPTTGVTNKVRGTPEDAEQKKIEEYDACLTNWYDARDVFTPFVEGLPTLLTRGSSLYRIYIPYHLLDDGGFLPEVEDMDAALDLIRLMPISHANGRTVKTSSGDIIGAWFVYQEGNNRITEIHYVDLVTNETVIQTNISGVGGNNGAWSETRMDIGGKLLIVEVSRRYPFVTRQAMQLSNLLNVDFTVLGRNLTQAGFLERIITNAQMPGRFEDKLDEEGDIVGKTFIPDPMYYGTGTTNVLVGVEQVDEDGQGTGKRADPKVHYRDPVPVTTFVDTDDMLSKAIYSEFKQGHMMIAGSSTTTGRSREQALNDFSASIRFSARIINRGLSQIFDTAMALAAWMCDDTEYIKNYKTVVSARLTMKLLTPDEKRVIMEQYAVELISAESAMLEIGMTSDPEAEFALIDGESERRDAFMMRQVKAGAAFATSDGGTSTDPGDSGKAAKKPKPKSDNGVGTK